MNNKFKVLSITFDEKVKITIVICAVIASIIIAYSFYYICFREKKEKLVEEKAWNIDTLLNINKYDAEYDVVVNSNKTSNIYNVKEAADIEAKSFSMVINDTLYITMLKGEINIRKEGINYEYQTINDELMITNNPISFSTIIECARKILNNDIKGNINRIEHNEKYIYQICFNEEYIKNIEKVEIFIPKENFNINQIKMYNKDGKEQYLINFKSFTDKK